LDGRKAACLVGAKVGNGRREAAILGEHHLQEEEQFCLKIGNKSKKILIYLILINY
jgi:hypothetical protein